MDKTVIAIYFLGIALGYNLGYNHGYKKGTYEIHKKFGHVPYTSCKE